MVPLEDWSDLLLAFSPWSLQQRNSHKAGIFREATRAQLLPSACLGRQWVEYNPLIPPQSIELIRSQSERESSIESCQVLISASDQLCDSSGGGLFQSMLSWSRALDLIGKFRLDCLGDTPGPSG